MRKDKRQNRKEISNILFIHSPSLHEAHRMFAEALYSPSSRKALGERCFAKAIEADFEPVYKKELTGFRRFLNAFKSAKEYPDYPVYVLEGGMPMFTVCLKKRKNYKYICIQYC